MVMIQRKRVSWVKVWRSTPFSCNGTPRLVVGEATLLARYLSSIVTYCRFVLLYTQYLIS